MALLNFNDINLMVYLNFNNINLMAHLNFNYINLMAYLNSNDIILIVYLNFNGISFQGVNGYCSVKTLFSLLSVISHNLLGKRLQWFPVAFSAVLNPGLFYSETGYHPHLESSVYTNI